METINKMKPKMITFDIDNTLVYGEKAKKFYEKYSTKKEKEHARELGCTIDEAQSIANQHRRDFGGKGELSFDTFGLSMDAWYDAIASFDPYAELEQMTKTSSVLQTLKESGFALGAVTDGPTKQAYRILDATGISSEIFSFIVGWEKGGRPPKYGSSDIFKKISTEQNLNPEEILMVGDSLGVDIIPAKEVGFQTFHINDEQNIESLIDYVNKYENRK